MSSDSTAADRRIMTQLGEAHRIPLVNLREGDFGVLVGFPVAGLLTGSVLFDPLVVPLALVGLVVGVAAVYAAPRHLTASAWLRDVGRYLLCRPRYTLSQPAGADHSGTDGESVPYTPFIPDERTQDLTTVARAWPGTGVIEREDGALEAFIAVTPGNMDFAMSGDWERLQTTAARFANNDLEFPLTVHTTTRAFPADRLVDRLADRQADPDVTSNDAFAALLREYRDRRPAELADTTRHRYYLGVTVTPSDVASRRPGESSVRDRLTAIPIAGVVVAAFLSRPTGNEPASRRQAMYDRLCDRLHTLEQDLVEPMADWEHRRLSTLELFVLAAEFWNGREYDDAERLLATAPAPGRARRREDD
ncbi:hypothetical protein [Halobaculum saliterrae]|nr:hypothetical protein [Halobaculum saliterrae]